MRNRTIVSAAEPYLQDDRHWTYVLTDTAMNIEVSDWSLSNNDLDLPVAFSIRKRTLHGGRQEGSTLIEIDTDAMSVTLIPTRGMSLLDAQSGDVALGWTSPVDEIVHPAFINLEQRGGLGWLDGFNELMVRCGFEWTGHACEDEGKRYTLHGRSGNTPASTVVVQIARAHPHRISVHGLLKEKTFKFSDLEVWAGLSVVPGEARIEIHDRVTNLGDYAQDYQVIYHTNFGPPLLEPGAKVVAPVAEVSPFNDAAVAGLDDWATYAAPTPGFDEMVFNCSAYADESDDRDATLAALVNASETRGVAIRYSTRQLPALTLWKNTDTLKQGYVTGLEPGTNPPYQRIVEREMGRVRKLAPQESARFDLAIEVLTSDGEVEQVKDEVLRLMAGRATQRSTRQKRFER